MIADRRARGFTLLEVLVAISILGIGLTAILSAQTGLFASSLYSEKVSVAVGLVRCRMSELEIKLQKMGYPLTDQSEEGVCCGDEPTTGFTCKWKVEKILLPNPPQNTLGIGSASAAPAGSGAPSALPTGTSSGSLAPPSGLGPIGALAAIGASGGSVLGATPQIGDLSKMFSGSGSSPLGGGASGAMAMGMSGSQALAPLVMSFVYPTLKPMLEASIRKLTVTVEWTEGSKTRNVEAVQFVTNPQQGGIDPNAAAGLDAMMGGLGGLLGGGAGQGTPGAGLGTQTQTPGFR